jgi:hypothetical protein
MSTLLYSGDMHLGDAGTTMEQATHGLFPAAKHLVVGMLPLAAAFSVVPSSQLPQTPCMMSRP